VTKRRSEALAAGLKPRAAADHHHHQQQRGKQRPAIEGGSVVLMIAGEQAVNLLDKITKVCYLISSK
jgi:hypothetical protein